MKTPTKAPAPELSSLVNDTMGDGKKTRPEKKPLQEIKKIDWLEDDLKRKGFDDEAIDKNSEMRALNTVFEAECKRIEAAVFRAYGEFDLADLMERNREAYDQLMGVGKKYFTK